MCRGPHAYFFLSTTSISLFFFTFYFITLYLRFAIVILVYISYYVYKQSYVKEKKKNLKFIKSSSARKPAARGGNLPPFRHIMLDTSDRYEKVRVSICTGY